MTSKHCEECGNFINCKYYLQCSGDASHASSCPGFIIETEIVLYNVKKFKGVASVAINQKPKPPKQQPQKEQKRVENRLPFLL